MERTIYDWWVGILVADSARDAANSAMVALTGKEANIYTFMCQVVKDDQFGWVANMPMLQQHYDLLPLFQQQVGGEWVGLSKRIDGVWEEYVNFNQWLEQLGFSIVVNEDPEMTEAPNEQLD